MCLIHAWISLTPDGEGSGSIDASLWVGRDAGELSWILETDWFNLQATRLQQCESGNLYRTASDNL